MVLSQEALEKIISMSPEENDHWDFKLQWYKKNDRNNLLLDIIKSPSTYKWVMIYSYPFTLRLYLHLFI